MGLKERDRRAHTPRGESRGTAYERSGEGEREHTVKGGERNAPQGWGLEEAPQAVERKAVRETQRMGEGKHRGM